MPLTPQDLLDRLAQLGIDQTTHWHPPVFTVEQTKDLRLHETIPGAHVKNLFLKDKTGTFRLVTMLEHRRVPVGALARALGVPRMSFASAEELTATLGVIPGAVTPFALINDTAHRVAFVLDEALLSGRYARINAHPLTNEATTSVTPEGFRAFLAATGHAPRLVALDALDTAAG
jgi:Ala-tRNA(Pro) deacylase